MIYPIIDLSFPDYAVRAMSIDHKKKIAIFDMDGAWLDGRIEEGQFVIRNWRLLNQCRYVAPNTWVNIPLGQEESLKDILELIVDGDQIVVRGFGAVTGDWIELVAKGGQGEYRTRE